MSDHPIAGFKYLVIADDEGEQAEFAFAFPPDHDERSYAASYPGRVILGAGFLRFNYERDGQIYRLECHGGSESLGVKAGKCDADYFTT